MEFKHPKYYKELRKLRNKLDQAISKPEPTGHARVRLDPGLKQRDSQVVNQVKLSSQSQASSTKQQAASKPEPVQVQASSAKFSKRQATSVKP